MRVAYMGMAELGFRKHVSAPMACNKCCSRNVKFYKSATPIYATPTWFPPILMKSMGPRTTQAKSPVRAGRTSSQSAKASGGGNDDSEGHEPNSHPPPLCDPI